MAVWQTHTVELRVAGTTGGRLCGAVAISFPLEAVVLGHITMPDHDKVSQKVKKTETEVHHGTQSIAPSSPRPAQTISLYFRCLTQTCLRNPGLVFLTGLLAVTLNLLVVIFRADKWLVPRQRY